MEGLPDNSEPAIIQMFWYRGTTRCSYLSSLRDILAQNHGASIKKTRRRPALQKHCGKSTPRFFVFPLA